MVACDVSESMVDGTARLAIEASMDGRRAVCVRRLQTNANQNANERWCSAAEFLGPLWGRLLTCGGSSGLIVRSREGKRLES